MADFTTHVTTSSLLGVAYGGAAYAWLDTPPTTCVLAGALCGVSGMLPDLDSDSGVPLRESIAFSAAVVPMLLIERFRHYGLSTEEMVLAGAAIYAAIRFGFAWLLKKYTVHRGMFHSLPAALIAGLCAFMICASGDLAVRFYKSGAVLAGFLSHLLLDELWAIRFQHGIPRLKKSFGTAMKLWSDSTWANVSTYAKLVVLTLLAVNDPLWQDHLPEDQRNLPQVASTLLEHLWK
jgi:membrane-bound metal-dependent hydrolase YbcI (DUF457 family)